MQAAINRAITFGDIHNNVRSRANPYTCLDCESVFQIEEFPLLPSFNGFLLCETCYKKHVDSLKEKPFSGGYLVNLLDTNGIDQYAFNHGATLSIRAVGYNQINGYFLLKQEICDCGDGYYVMELPSNLDIKDTAEVLAYEKSHKYSEKMIYGLFHPFLLFVQFYDISSSKCDMLTQLRHQRIDMK